MSRLLLSCVAASVAAGCTPAAAPKQFPAQGEAKATLVFNTGEADDGAFDYLAENLASQGVSVTLAKGPAWRKAAARSLSPDACTLVGGYAAAARDTAAFVKDNVANGLDGALFIGGLIGPDQNLNRAGVPSATILAGGDASTPPAAITDAQMRSTDPASFSVIADVDNQAFVAGDASRRKEIVDFAGYDIRWMCGKRIERQEKVEDLRRWEESQRSQAKEPSRGPAP